jgi:WWE domain/Zinc finger, C3HC4 type (RING finger)
MWLHSFVRQYYIGCKYCCTNNFVFFSKTIVLFIMSSTSDSKDELSNSSKLDSQSSTSDPASQVAAPISDTPTSTSTSSDADNKTQKNTETTADSDSDEDEDCCVCSDTIVTPFSVPACSHTFCYMCIKSVLQQAERGVMDLACPLCRGPVSRADLLSASMKKSDWDKKQASIAGDTDASDTVTVQWQYAGRSGWWLYDNDTNEEIEAYYQTFQSTGAPPADEPFTIRIGVQDYIVDFTAMMQRSAEHAWKKRKIQRVAKKEMFDKTHVKGQAGVHFERTPSKSGFA